MTAPVPSGPGAAGLASLVEAESLQLVAGSGPHPADAGLPSAVGAAAPLVGLAAAIDAELPQTQCTRCGYPDCRSYAQAIASDAVPINRCPPGGAEGIARLARLVGVAVLPLDPAHGHEAPRVRALIDEAWCIGCALCLDACPVDAIVGAAKQMHTVIDADCTGCELCVPVCPVDCIALEPVTTTTGWQAWSPEQADRARGLYERHRRRSATSGRAPTPGLEDDAEVDASGAGIELVPTGSSLGSENAARMSPAIPGALSPPAEQGVADVSAERRRAIVAAALAAARQARRT